MRALVTGAAGFVGRHMVQELVRRDYEVAAVDPAFPKAGQVGSVWRYAQPFREWARTSSGALDVAVHCGAVIPPIDARTRNGLSTASNLGLDTDFFGWALERRPAQVLYFSSCAVYPLRATSVLDEFMVDLVDFDYPNGIYGLTKLMGEIQARELQRLGVETVVVRPFSGYGEDQAPPYPFPTFVERALRHDDPFEVWGTGRQVRDWVHVDDIIGASLTALEEHITLPMNIGTGRGVTMDALALMISEAAGTPFPPRLAHRPEMPTGAHTRVADTSLMYTVYAPKVSLELGIQRAVGSAHFLPERTQNGPQESSAEYYASPRPA